MKTHPKSILIPVLAALLLTLVTCQKEEPVRQATLSTLSVTNITINAAQSGGNITSDGGGEITSRGVVWGTSPNPTAEQNLGLTMNGAGSGLFQSNITNLQPNTTYYVRAYATNKAGMVYGNQQQFTTMGFAPTVNTNPISNISHNSATGGGNITNDGGSNITARGVVWSISQNPTLESNSGSTSNGSGTGGFTSNMTELSPNTTYFVRAYAKNTTGTSYGSQESFTTIAKLPTVTTNLVTNISETSATVGGNVTDDGGAEVTERGIAFGTAQNPTTSDNKLTSGSGTGSFTGNLTGLTSNTTFYVRAYATNIAGTAYGTQVGFTTLGDDTQLVEVTNPSTGRVWMDRNLGASRAAISSHDALAYGHLYQWGRATDGHQLRTSGTTSTLNNSDTPGHGNFILAPNSPNDWRSPQNTNLWQGLNGTNNPCPAGYRLPTEAELNAERLSWSSNNTAGAFASHLKFPLGGYRFHVNGSFTAVGGNGLYWTGTVDGIRSRSLIFFSGNANIESSSRAQGFSVRCIKD